MAMGTDQAIDTPRLLLTGASSQIGVFAIPRLVRAGFQVLAVSRKGKPPGYPVFEQVEWLKEAEAASASESCQFLLSTGPMQLALKFLETGKQFISVIVFSSSSVVVKKESFNIAERQQIEHMLTLEEELRFSAQKQDIKLVIFRPTLVYGCGLDANISRLAAWIRRFGFIPVNGKASGMRQPVHADDLAGAAVSALLSKKGLPPLLYLSGGQSLSYSDMARRIFMAYRKSPRLLHLPQWLFAALVNLAAIFGRGHGVNAEMVRRQRLDLVFDDRQARELLGYEPRPFAPNKEDFSWEDTVNGIGAT